MNCARVRVEREGNWKIMGQTVSLGACISGGSRVRVMNTEGVFENYEFPTVTAEVMLQHPDHLVVHCQQTQKGIGNRNKINIMLPEQPLLPGQPYMLYPIPERHKHLLAKSKSFSMIKRQIEAKSANVSTHKEKKTGRRFALKLVVTRLQLATVVASKMTKKEDEEQLSPLVEAKEEETKKKKSPPQPLDMPIYNWHPALASIPESPLGFHSIPQTPRGLYKMANISEEGQSSPGEITTTTTAAAV